MKRLAVIGSNVTHSLSPQIHSDFAVASGIDIVYERINVLEQTIVKYLQLLDSDYCGFNITNPYKNKVIPTLQKLNFCVNINAVKLYLNNQLIVPVNTLVAKRKQIYAYNTDGDGLLKDLTVNNKFIVQGKKIAILGTGGACLGIIPALIRDRVKQITIVGRNVQVLNNIILNTGHKDSYTKIYITTFNDINMSSILVDSDLIINATSAGHKNALPMLPDSLNLTNSYCYDLNYGIAASNFMNWAYKNKANFVSSGIGMLIEQAAISFKHWFNVAPETKNVIAKFTKIAIIP